MLGEQGAVEAELPAVDVGADLEHVRRVGVAAGGRELHQHPQAARHHDEAGAGRRQRQRAAAPGKVVDELLGERAAPGDAEDVDLPDPERVEQPRRQPRQPGEAVGQRRRRRAADARHVEGDDAGVAEVRREGRHRLEARADPVEDEERAGGVLGAVQRHADLLPGDPQGPDVDLAHLRAPVAHAAART